MKKRIYGYIALLLALACCACGKPADTASNAPVENPLLNTEQPGTDPPEVPLNTTRVEGNVPRTGGEISGISEETLADAQVDVQFMEQVPNDPTGFWRVAKLSDTLDFNTYALDYYKTYFKSDDEVHAIIDPVKQTTTVVFRLIGRLDVTVYAYAPGEEQDWNTLAKGDKLDEYYIYLDNGEIERAK